MQTVLITGANRGIGLAFCKAYATSGWSVIATARNPDAATELDDFSKENKNVRILQLDCADPHSIRRMSTDLRDVKLDLLVNNAGVFIRDSFEEEFNPDSLLCQFRVNSIGPLLVSQALLQNLASKDSVTKIVNITSSMGSIGDGPSGSLYGYRASKTALNMFTKLLSKDVESKGHQIAVLSLHPGYIQTDMTGGKGDMSPNEAVARMVRVIDSLDMSASGTFKHRDGHTIPW